MYSIPHIGSPLEPAHVEFLKTFSKSCRDSIVRMTTNAQSGHPGGSLSCIDYLSVLYCYIVSQTGEDVVISNGHISPAVYSVLAELGYTDKKAAIEGFRKIGEIYEGHITRHVRGVVYGTGPLGIGVAVAAGMAQGEHIKGTHRRVFSLVGDGEAQEGEVYEMMHFSKKYQLSNLILFVDYNKVQLTDSLENVMPLDIPKSFASADWHVIEINAHDYAEIWEALRQAYAVKNQPVVIVGHSIMGKGIDVMEADGLAHKATWHGNAPKPEVAEEALATLDLTPKEQKISEGFRSHVKWTPPEPIFPKLLSEVKLDVGSPVVYEPGTVTDCRSAYGKALLDLAKRNKNVLAMTADLRGSVMTQGVANEIPERHVEFGIAEQCMVSAAGGFSLQGFIPFASTFGAFMSSRAKDQARVNDINQTNVKMVATHCGLSVGEDGPTHQAIDDMGSFLGFFHTMVIEPADANQCDRIIRYVASHYGNFYVRMGRHKFPVLLKEDGSVFYDEKYVYKYGRSDVIRSGKDLTIAASGAMVGEALKARELISKSHPDVSLELVAVSSIKQLDKTLLDSIRKTKHVLTVEDHNTRSGLASQVALHLTREKIHVDGFYSMGVEEYQLSGKWDELYAAAGLAPNDIAKNCLDLLDRS